MAWDVEYSDPFAESWGGTAMAQKVDKLFRKMSPRAQRRVEQRANEEYQALALAELREAQDLTQVQLAEKLGIDQGAVSKIERRTDMYLSTLRNIIQAMGGQLELTACFPTGRVQVLTFRDADRSGKKRGKNRSSRTIRRD
jgi:DNA-binding XRE family transcriptional regulator